MQRKQRKSVAQPSDIAFLLIIFFLLLAGIDTSQTLELTMGSSGRESGSGLQVRVNAAEEIFVAQQRIGAKQLVQAIPPGSSVSLMVEAGTSWQTVITLLDLLEAIPLEGLSVEMSP